MTRETADELLPKFKQLEGMYSEFFSSKIERVIVSYKSFKVIRWHREYLQRNFSSPTALPYDEVEYTIVVVLKNGRMQSVKTLVRKEQIQELYGEVKVVDYMTG